MDEAFNNLAQYSRCDSPQSLLEHGCNPDQIVNPQSSLRTIQNEQFTDGSENDQPTIQLRPQHVEIFIRPSLSY